ncbi:hypothetical protein N0V93_001653 [Gnomoniopsis smithogilvyi]|uniref:Calmodulin n=1 Tax=Gnomoniopsis smithogilvyi TaxID=1191159 RepID=A0A9W8Z437_9PEZI|nr:hypothetical protein N0V93_001653 [Gnomoniopsis smithogilvyi]
MDTTSSAAATLTRPRLAIQVVTGLAAAFIIYQAWQQRTHLSSSSASGSAHATHNTGGGPLHRSNAVRRTERSTRRHIEGALQEIENEYGSEQRQALESILERHFRTHDSHPLADANPVVPDATNPPPNTDENAGLNRPVRSHVASQGEGEAETVAGEEPSVQSEWDQEQWLVAPPRSGHNIVGLLFRVSEDNARRNAYVHRGCMCNACGLLPIRGIRYRCANCADFDLCETCESQGLHNKTHVFYKVKVPAPPFGPKSMQPVWYPGDPDTALRNLPSPLIKHLARETGFERPELEALWEQWTFIANTEWRDDPDELYLAADRKTFERYLVPSSGTKRSAPNLIHDRMFAFYDTNGDGLISFPEFLKGLSYKKGKERLERIFKGYDIDGDGYISRRDCLRIFRTYYVLYKHMHGDVIEGLDQQALSTTETQQLVTGRQPLSSHFGREGRVPEADHGRPMEGKVFHSNGDVFITDGKAGVVNETRADVGNREEIISSLFNHAPPEDEYGSRFYTPASEHVTSPSGDEVARLYHEALLNPPTRVEELVSLLVGESRNIQPGEMSQGSREEQQNVQEDDGSEDTSVEDDDQEALRPNGDGASSSTRPSTLMRFTVTANGVTSTDVTSSPPVALLREAGDERWTNRPPTESQLRAQHLRLEAHRKRVMDRKLRDTVRKKLFDRWQKRNFYLVEEEGGSPPEGFDQDDDVLGDTTATEAMDSNVGQPPLSARSRSSSKVRFAEDTDDYEIRSNPSTSSRSVPERWGGMDIPDAERDMGKEILYVVTQQAFNEILDVLFKEKEDLAVKAAQSKEWRDAYRDVLDAFDPDHPPPSQQQSPESGDKIAVLVEVDENKPTQDKDLSELLATEGYTIDESLAANVKADATPRENGHEAVTSEEEDYSSAESFEGSEPEATVDQLAYRDPTMPQFRPNSDAQLPKSAGKRRRPASLKGFDAPDSASKGAPPRSKDRPLTRPPHRALVEWKELDKAEAEAKERGGWGRLSLNEFKDIWREEASGPQRLDYLGTWIDFCIP